MEHEEKPITLNLSHLVSVWKSKQFSTDFLAALDEHSHSVPLWAVCEAGTPSSEDLVKFTNLKLEDEHGNKVSGSFGYSFTEVVEEGCGNNRRKHPQRGRLNFDFNFRIGSLEIHMPLSRFEP